MLSSNESDFGLEILLRESYKFVPLKVDSTYEICVNYPHRIGSVSDKYYPKVSIANGYFQLSLEGGPVTIHWVIGMQWVHNFNPETDTEIDHIDGNRRNNRIANLRWCSRTENQRNRHSSLGETVEFLDVLPEGSRMLKRYRKHVLEPGYWIDNDFQIYFKNNLKYYRLKQRLHDKLYPCFYVKIFGFREIAAVINVMKKMKY
jgi:hypothetical protein